MKTILSSISTLALLATLASAQPLSCSSGLAMKIPCTMATYPAGTVLENVAIAPSGDLYVSAIDSGTVFQVSTSGSSRIFGQVSGPLLGLAFDEDGRLIAAGGNSVYRFETNGTSSLVTNIAGAVSLNGVARLSPGVFLIADDSTATVWKVDLSAKTTVPWMTGGLLVPPPDGLPIGPNGIKVFRGSVYISVTGAGTILQVPIRPDGSAGTPQIYVSSFQVDDFVFGSDGSIFAATQVGSVLRLHPGGQQSTIPTGTLGDAAVAFGGTPFDIRNIYVVNNGGVFLGLPDGPRPASVIRLTVNMTGIGAQ